MPFDSSSSPTGNNRRLPHRVLKRVLDRMPSIPRKRAKLEDDKATASEGEASNKSITGPTQDIDKQADQATSGTATPSSSTEQTTQPNPPQVQNQPKEQKLVGRRSWYGSGSWRSKASPVVAQVARENVGVTGGSTQELPSPGAKQTTPNTPADLLSKRRSSKSIPLAASTTRLHVSSNGDEDSIKSQETPKDSSTEPPLPPYPTNPTVTGEQKAEKEAGENAVDTQPSRWTGWWSLPDIYGSVRGKVAPATVALTTEEAQRTPLPGTTPVEEPDQARKELSDTTLVEQPISATGPDNAAAPQTVPQTEPSEKLPTQGRSWFSLWSRAENARNIEQQGVGQEGGVSIAQPTEATQATTVQDPKATTNAPAFNGQDTNVPAQAQESAIDTKTEQPMAKKSWAFWSKDTPSTQTTSETVHKEVGEIAVTDTPSQSKPEIAQFNEQGGEAPKDAPPPANAKGKTRLKELAKKKSLAKSKSGVDLSKEARATDSSKKAVIVEVRESRNLLLPEFRDTYKLVQIPSIWQQIRKYLLGTEASTPNLQIVPSPPRIKKALAIGVHGFFPAQLVRTFLGQPTGTSIRFANAAATAIHEWTQKHGGYTCEVEKVALEGEGFIEERVSSLWKLLLNWIDHVRQADFILVACHSQGVPVAVMLLAKLIAFGCVSPTAKIGVCAMAGINLGPFVEYKTKYLGNTAFELFDFSDPKSKVSKDYMAALKELLQHGVKIVYVGSIDDQLVSLESSTFSNISHPYIYRAVFVDSKLHAPDFITHLVAFVLKLRNLGLPDHGLIRELSPAVAGSLYTGEGHSRIHEDPKPYALAVTHVLETTNLPQAIPLSVREYEGVMSSTNPNPYYLPWAMRGLLEEEFVKKELGKEVDELLSLFEKWKPTTKGLKDIKFRLEAVRSKL